MVAKRGTSIGRKVAALAVGCIGLTIAVSAGLTLAIGFNSQLEARRESARHTGIVLAAAIAENVAAGDRYGTLSGLRSIARLRDVVFAAAIDSSGQEIASLGQSPFIAAPGNLDDVGLAGLLAHPVLPVGIEIVKAGAPVGRLVMVVNVADFRQQILNGIVLTVVTSLLALLAGLAAALWLQSGITRPLTLLAGAMSRVRESRDYSTKVERLSDDETGQLADSFNAMMTEIRSRDAALNNLAYFDPLTGLANRQKFQLELDNHVAAGGTRKSGGVVLLDLDEFKQVNDSFGHVVGDGLLMSVAARLKEAAGANVLVARLGGDEFVALVHQADSEAEVERVAAALAASLLKPIMVMDREFHVGSSVGVAVYPRDGLTSADILRRADLALYAAKRAGRGRMMMFRRSMDEEARDRTNMLRDLRQAVAAGVLEYHFQPQLALASGQVEGFESLVRWRHPARGYVPPARFIPVAEESGVILALGVDCLRQSCRIARSWLDRSGRPREVSVNVSVVQLFDPEFQKAVERVLRESALPPELLCLEITETVFAGRAPALVAATLGELRGLGLRLALDDFGTGYSSFSYLGKLPFDKVKIDRSFVTGIDADRKKRALLYGMVGLIHSLGARAVGEGAENEAEFAALVDLGVDHVQGYAIGRAVPPAAIAAEVARIEAERRPVRPEAIGASA